MKALVPWNWFEQEKNMPSPHCCSGAYPALAHFGSVFKEMDRMLNDFWWASLPEHVAKTSLLKPDHPMRMPRLDITGDEKKYSINAELPGIEEKDLKVELAGKTLTISAEKNCGCEKKDDEKATKGKNKPDEKKQQDYYCQERSYGYYQRILTLPDDAEIENINGSFKNGVLTLTISRKSSPEIATKTIAINSESTTPSIPS